MYAPFHDRLNADSKNAISEMEKAYTAYEDAKKAAICAVITDVLGEEWTAKQFKYGCWRYYGIKNMPSLDTMLEKGWISRRVEEFELPMSVKAEIAAKKITVTFDDGRTYVTDTDFACYYVVGQRPYGRSATVVKVEHKMPEFKGRRYIYRLA